MAKACNLAHCQERKVKNSPCVRTPYFQPFRFQNWALSARVSQLSIKSLARETVSRQSTFMDSNGSLFSNKSNGCIIPHFSSHMWKNFPFNSVKTYVSSIKWKIKGSAPDCVVLQTILCYRPNCLAFLIFVQLLIL